MADSFDRSEFEANETASQGRGHREPVYTARLETHTQNVRKKNDKIARKQAKHNNVQSSGLQTGAPVHLGISRTAVIPQSFSPVSRGLGNHSADTFPSMVNNRPNFGQGYSGPPFQYLGVQSPGTPPLATAIAQYHPGLSTGTMHNAVASTSANGGFNSVSQTWSNTPLHNVGSQDQEPGVHSHAVSAGDADINFSFAERDQSEFTQTQSGLGDTEDPDATSARSSLMTDEQLVTHAMPASASMFTSTPISLPPQTGIKKRKFGPPLVRRTAMKSPVHQTHASPSTQAHAPAGHQNILAPQHIASAQSGNKENEGLDPSTGYDGHGASDLEDLDSPPPPKKSRPATDRSARDIVGDRKVLLECAYDHFKALVCTETPFPVESDLSSLVMSAWEAAADEKGVDGAPTLQEMRLIRARASQVRGQLKRRAVTLVERIYGFQSIDDIETTDVDNDHREAQDQMEATNRDLVEKLKHKSAFARLDPHDPTVKNSLYRNKIIQKLVNQQWFSGMQADGIRLAEYYAPDGECLPLITIALVLTAVECAIDGWSSGRCKTTKSDNTFDVNVYRPRFDAHLTKLNDWWAFTSERPGQLTTKLQQNILQAARRNAGIHHAPATAPVESTLTFEDFEADEM